MKYRKSIFFLVVISISLTACSGNKNEKLQGEFRRFCVGYDLPSNILISESAVPSANININDFRGTGIQKIDVYADESSLFAIIDVDPEYSVKQALQSLRELNSSDVSNALSTLLSDENGQLLERIFELDQKVEYKAEEGQLKNKRIADYKRYVSTLELEEDSLLIEEYKRIHGIGMCWPEIVNNMKEIGVLDMELYIMGTRAFLIMDTNLEYNPKTDNDIWAKKPREKEWQTYVSRFQKTSPDSDILAKWKSMEVH